MIKMCKTITLCVGVSLFATPAAFAVPEDGDLSSTSSHVDSELDVEIPTFVKLSKVENQLINATGGSKYAGSGDIEANDDVCVYSNDASNTYNVKLSCAGCATDATGFKLTNTASTNVTIPYTAYWNEARGTAGETAFNQNTASLASNAATTTNCGGAADTDTNANFHVKIDEDDLQKVNHGWYSGTLTITITPAS